VRNISPSLPSKKSWLPVSGATVHNVFWKTASLVAPVTPNEVFLFPPRVDDRRRDGHGFLKLPFSNHPSFFINVFLNFLGFRRVNAPGAAEGSFFGMMRFRPH